MSDIKKSGLEIVGEIIGKTVLANKEAREQEAAKTEQIKAETKLTEAKVKKVEAEITLLESERQINLAVADQRFAEAERIRAEAKVLLETSDLATHRSRLIEQSKSADVPARTPAPSGESE
jgi:hypothetical protein